MHLNKNAHRNLVAQPIVCNNCLTITDQKIMDIQTKIFKPKPKPKVHKNMFLS